MSATGFSTDWLEERYRFDQTARSAGLTDLFIQHLGAKTSYHLLDLGAGIGSNVKYFSNKINADQYWYLLEIDQNLIEYGKSSLQKFFTENDFDVKINAREIVAKKKNTIHVSYIRDSIFNLKPTQYLAFDGILGNALLDVFTLVQLQALFNHLSNSHAPKLFSIIYQNMEWLDEDIDNTYFIAKYHDHMQRMQANGPALGPNCVDTLKQHISVGPDTMLYEISNWEVKPSEKSFLNHLLGFYKISIPETSIDPGFNARFKKWLTQKSKHLSKGLLGAKVLHQDLLWIKKDSAQRC